MAQQFPLFPIEKFPVDKFPIHNFPIDKFPIDRFLRRLGAGFAFLPSLNFSLDIVTANLSGGDEAISVLRNQGAGGFTRSDYTLGNISEPLGVALADLDGDGDTDVVATNGGTVSVLLSDGVGGFSQSDTELSPFILRESVLGDLDNDDNLDIVTAASIGKSISVLLNNGSGGFSESSRITTDVTGNIILDLALGDIDADGYLDIVASNSDSSNERVSVLLNDGAGSFVSTDIAIQGDILDIALGDFNGDGDLDIVTGMLDNSVKVLRGNGEGGFTEVSSFQVGNQPVSIAVGDLNGDGRVDIVTGNAAGDNVSVLINDGAGGFARSDFAAGDQPGSIALGDLNGDGIIDIATANFNSSNISVLLGNGIGGFTAPINFAVGADPVAIALGNIA